MDAPWASLDANMAWRARRVRQRAQEAAAVDVIEVESHSPAPHMMQQSGRRNRVVVDVAGSSQDGSIIDLTSISTIRVPGSD